MSDHDAIIRDLETSLMRLAEERDTLRDDVIRWRGLARALGIGMSTSYHGPAALEREESEKYRRAVWVLAAWAYAATVDRAPDDITPDIWVRWALRQDDDPSPPPVPAVVG